jgi:hypothetical protein
VGSGTWRNCAPSLIGAGDKNASPSAPPNELQGRPKLKLTGNCERGFHTYRNDARHTEHVGKPDHAKLAAEAKEKFRKETARYVRQYGFISQVMTFTDPKLEKFYLFAKLLLKQLPSSESHCHAKSWTWWTWTNTACRRNKTEVSPSKLRTRYWE